MVRVWVIYTVLGLLAMIAALVWAARTRQFSRQDRARYLPLDEGPPGEGGGKAGDEAQDKKAETQNKQDAK